MKRVVFCILTLVAVGLIGAMAIAQVHRGDSSAGSGSAVPSPGQSPASGSRSAGGMAGATRSAPASASSAETGPRIFKPAEDSRPIPSSNLAGPSPTPKAESEIPFPGPNPLRSEVFPVSGTQPGNGPSQHLAGGDGQPGSGSGNSNSLRGPGSAPTGESSGGGSAVNPSSPMFDPFGDRMKQGTTPSAGQYSPAQVERNPSGNGALSIPGGTRVAQNPSVSPPNTVSAPPSPSGGREPAPFQVDPHEPTARIGTGNPGSVPGTMPPLGGNSSLGGNRSLTPNEAPGMLSAPSARPLPPAGGAGSALGPGEGGGLLPGGAGDQEEGTGQPGSKVLEGPQTAQITIHKQAPAEVQVGRPAKFQIKVVNTGSVAAADVELRDQIPRGARLVRTQPTAQRGVGGDLVWKLGTLAPGQEITVEMEVLPTTEGEIGSVATVHYGAEASARTVVTRPLLDIKVSHPPQVVVGDSTTMSITVSNPGTGVAEGVVLEAHVPEGFQHPAGNELEYEVGTLRPRESRQLELILTAVRPGVYEHLMIGRAEGNLRTESRQTLRVLAPQLELQVAGSTRRYLEREALYQIAISNVGSAPAKGVTLTVEVPPGMKFVSADNHGYYEQSNRTVSWRLAELPVQTTGTVKLTLLPEELGQKVLRIATGADRHPTVQKEHPVEIEGIVALNFHVADTVDPVEKGTETTYEIRVYNQGSKTASNVQLEAMLAPQMRVVAAEGPARHIVEEGRVRFENLARLAPKAEATYRIRVQCLQPGDLRMRVHLSADEMERPVLKEESTRVYSNE